MLTPLGCPHAPRAHRLASWLILVACLAPAPLRAQAQWMTNGLPVCVIPGCSGRLPLICSDGAGGAVIAWNRNPTLADENIYVHRVLNGGVLDPIWPPKGTPATRALNDQYLTDIAPDGQGGAFVVWFDYRDILTTNIDAYAQHVLGTGAIAPGWPADGLAVSTALGEQNFPRLLADGAGGAFIVWQDGSGISAGDIRAQHLNADGARVAGWPADGLAVCTAPGVQGRPYLGADGQGGIIVAWGDRREAASGHYAQRITWAGELASGWPVDGRLIAPENRGGFLYGVVPDGVGGAYVAWQYQRDVTGIDADIFATRILADGSIAPGWPSESYPVCALPNAQYLSSVVADSTGGVLLAWYDHRTYPAVAYAQRLRLDGTPAPGWQQNGNRVSDLGGYHFAPRAAPDGHGGVFVSFQEAFYATGHQQYLTALGVPGPGWPSSGVPIVVDPTGASEQDELQATSDGVGGVILVWNDYRNGRQEQLYAQRYFGDGPTPVLVALVRAEALSDRVTLLWHAAQVPPYDATVYRRLETEAWSALGRASFDGTGRLTFEDRDVSPGEHYAYRLGWNESGVEQFSAESWVDVPVALALALEGARPNPAVGPLTVAFTLPRAETTTLELLDVAGRQLLARDVGELGPGVHVIRLGECSCTPPGMYWLRLKHAGQSLIKRAVVVR